jgi:hypothetical protein
MSERPAGAPGAGTLTVLAVAWLLAMLGSARRALGDAPETDPLAVVRAALELPQVVSASLVAGVAVGLATGNLLARLAPIAGTGAGVRFGTGTGAGLLAGLAVAVPIRLAYPGLPSVLAVSAAVAGAAGLGGLLSAVRHRRVLAAAVAGALGGFAVGLAERAFEGDLRHLLGGGESARSVLTATGWLMLTGSLLAGVVAGAAGYAYLRRTGPRWPAYLVAGAAPGLLALLAEVITRLGGARLFQAVGAASADDRAVLSFVEAARLNRALIVLFAGALVAVFLLGRTLRPATADPEPEPEPEPEPAGPDRSQASS